MKLRSILPVFFSLLTAVARAQTPTPAKADLPASFRFITPATTLQEVVDRIGPWQRVRGSGTQHYEYDLPDGSAVLVSPEWPFKLDNKIQTCTFYKKASDITLAP